MPRGFAAVGAAAALLALACGDRPRPETSEAAPAASLQPSPLVSATPPVDLSSNGAPERSLSPSYGGSGLPTPIDSRIDEPLPADALFARDATGVVIAGEWRWPDVAAPPKAPEVSLEGIAAARRLTTMRWVISLTETGRLRIVFDARALPLPLGTELRARADHFGHALVFPGGTDYRVVPPGALRALFGDRRLDVVPLVPGDIRLRGPAPPRHGRSVRRVEIASRTGVLQLDTLHVSEAGLGASLLCRLLVEMIAVDPSSAACVRDELPVRAQLTWPNGGSIAFDAGEQIKQQDLPAADMLCPPSQAHFATSSMPSQPSSVFLTREEAAAFRLRPLDLPAPPPGAPSEGLLARNAADGLRYFLLDGAPVAWVSPGSEQSLVGPPRGRYVVQWRSFLGDAISPPRTVELPARIVLSDDADAPLPAPAKSKLPHLTCDHHPDNGQ